MIAWDTIENILIEKKLPTEVVVAGTSMYPTIFFGDRVRLAPLTSIQELKNKDLVLIRAHNKYYIHRYFSEHQLTRGDNNLSWDPPADIYIAKVTNVNMTLISCLRRIFFYLLKVFSLCTRKQKPEKC